MSSGAWSAVMSSGAWSAVMSSGAGSAVVDQGWGDYPEGMSDQNPVEPDSDPTAPTPGATPAPASEGESTAQAPAQWPSAPAVPLEQGTGVPAVPPAPPGPPPAYPPAYGVPGAAPMYAPAPPTSTNAIIAFVLSIVSWAVCPIIPAIVALVLAASAQREIAAGQGRVQGGGLVTAAKVISWINIGFWAAIIVIGGFFLVLALVAGSA